MALNLKNELIERLARGLASETGESLTEAVAKALEERLRRIRGRGERIDRGVLAHLPAELAALPRYDERSDRNLGQKKAGDNGWRWTNQPGRRRSRSDGPSYDWSISTRCQAGRLAEVPVGEGDPRRAVGGCVIVETSAVVAMAFGEPEADRLVASLDGASSRSMASVTAPDCQMDMTRIWRRAGGVVATV